MSNDFMNFLVGADETAVQPLRPQRRRANLTSGGRTDTPCRVGHGIVEVDVLVPNESPRAISPSMAADPLFDTPVAPSLSSESAADDHGVTVACVSTPAELQALAGEWRELFEQIGCTNLFLSAEWMTTWWQHRGGTQRLLIVTVRLPSGRLIAVAPFYIRRSVIGPWGPRALCFLANTQVASDYLTVLVDPA